MARLRRCVRMPAGIQCRVDQRFRRRTNRQAVGQRSEATTCFRLVEEPMTSYSGVR